MPRRVHLHRGRVTVHRGRVTANAGSGHSTRHDPVSATVPAFASEHRPHLVQAERVARPAAARVDRERHAHRPRRRGRPARLRSRRAGAVPRARRRAPARRGAVDVRAVGHDLLADPGRRRRERSALGMPVDRADLAGRAGRRSTAPGPGAAGPTAPRGRAPGRTRRRSPASPFPSASMTEVERSPATTCAFVTTIPGAATQPLPSWIWWHAWPVTLTIERRTVASTAGASVAVGTAPGIGRGVERCERRRVRRLGDGESPRRGLRRLLRRDALDLRRRSTSRAPCAPASPARSRATG